jgi:hypothetical protein
MHYRNGKEAHEGDPVITRNYNNKIVNGTIHNLREGLSCNCDVSVLIPGGVIQLTCQDVGQMFHAADALAAIELQMANPAVEVPPGSQP